jgi:GNAT superfamily N-acetyltransferase
MTISRDGCEMKGCSQDEAPGVLRGGQQSCADRPVVRPTMLRQWVRGLLTNCQERDFLSLCRRLSDTFWLRRRYVAMKQDLAFVESDRLTATTNIASKVQFQVIAGYLSGAIPIVHIDEVPYVWPDTPTLLRQRLDLGEILFLGWLDGKVVWRSWLLRKDWKFLGARLDDGSTRICHCSLRCLSAYRRRGIAADALAFVADWARQHGYKEIWAFVRQYNTPSLSLHRSQSYRIAGYVEFYEVLGTRWTRWQSAGCPLGSIARAPHIRDRVEHQ